MKKFQYPLRPGMKVINETTGCCPSASLICDKSTCPPKQKYCNEEFYEIVPIIDPTACCEEFKCIPPKNQCIVLIDGKKYLKGIGEKWPTKDSCLTKECTIDSNGSPIEKELRETCPQMCGLVSYLIFKI